MNILEKIVLAVEPGNPEEYTCVGVSGSEVSLISSRGASLQTTLEALETLKPIEPLEDETPDTPKIRKSRTGQAS